VSLQPSLGQNLPNLRTLVLTENALGELADLEALARLDKLVHLSLVENPVTGKEVSLIRSCIHIPC
jgi:U2 small nuclear ribonucleoprotein A'